MPDAYVFRRKKKPSPRRVALVAAGGTFAAAGVVVGALFLFGVLGGPTDAPSFGDALPGSRAQAAGGLDLATNGTIPADLRKTAQALLAKDGLWLAWAAPASKDGKRPYEPAATMRASDQLLLLQHELEQGRRSSFFARREDFAASFVDADGLVRPAAPDDGSARAPADTLLYARLLAAAYARWPDAALLSACRAASDALLATVGADGLLAPDRVAVLPTNAPTPTDIPDETPTPTPSPTPGPSPTPSPGPSPSPSPTPSPGPVRTTTGLGLSQADFEAMRLLSAIDPRWTAVADAHLAVVLGGFLGTDLPLYAEAWSAQSHGYLPYIGASPRIDTLSSLLVVLHLAEVGQADPRSLAWLRDQVMDARFVATAYELATGAAATDEECVPAYAIAARIARIQGDAVYYAAAIARIDWNLATDAASKAYGAVFRKDAAGRVFVYAVDNAWALLALE